MSTVNIVLLVILAVLIVGLIVLYFLGKKAQKKRDEQEAQLADVYKRQASTLISLIVREESTFTSYESCVSTTPLYRLETPVY